MWGMWGTLLAVDWIRYRDFILALATFFVAAGVILRIFKRPGRWIFQQIIVDPIKDGVGDVVLAVVDEELAPRIDAIHHRLVVVEERTGVIVKEVTPNGGNSMYDKVTRTHDAVDRRKNVAPYDGPERRRPRNVRPPRPPE